MTLLSRLFARRPATSAVPVPVVPLPDGPLYAVGDVHGHLAKYDALESAIMADARARDEETVRIVTLGDYIDRGPDSAGVLERMCEPPPDGVIRHCLKGNHEAMFEDFLADPDLRSGWLDMGGRETLASYGLYADRMASAPRHVAQMVEAHIPAEHSAFLHALPLAFATSTHFLCHAGVDPALPLDAQPERALLWIREPFLSHDAPLERIVVHGHTPVAAPDLRGWRINVDTGVYDTGTLSAVRLDAAAPPHVVQAD